MNLDQLVAAAAAAMNLPESMVRRSAEARSSTEGRPIEVILGEWAGVDPGADAPEAPVAPQAPTDAAETPVAPQPPAAPVDQPAPPGPAASPASAPGDLVAKAAAAMGMSETMVKRSAAARAKAEGRSAEEVLAEWAGVELSTAAPPASAEPAPPPEVAPVAEASAPPVAAPAAAADGADLLAKAAAAQGLPEAMVKRSAAARAKAEGTTTEAVLAEWAGVEAAAATASMPTTAAAVPAAPAAAPAERAAAPAAAPAAVEVEVIAEGEEAAPLAPEPVRELELVTPSGALPRWLASLFIVVPVFAIAYAAFLPNGPNCGDAGKLAVDPVTGVAVNCDGSAFGEEEVDFFAIGSEVFGFRCAVCHGSNGGGIANFPSFLEGALVETFPEGSCDIHVQWVTLGTTGWPDPTYGANQQPVGGRGTMPTFGTQLTDQELRSVVLYERVQFGRLPLEETIADCGLAAAPTE